MYQIISNNTTGIISISDEYLISGTGSNTPPTLIEEDEIIILSFINLYNIVKFKNFSYDSIGEDNINYLLTYYRISRDGTKWSDWLELLENINNFPIIDSKDKLFIDIKWKKIGNTNTIKILKYNLNGTLDRNLFSEFPLILGNGQTEIIYKPKDILKIFKIDDIETIYRGDDSDILIKYRYSQDYGKTITDWFPFTKENITSQRINPIRFFQIEYLITSTKTIKIYDINLIGDFQNISKDSKKTNLFGIRDNCNSIKLCIVGDPNGEISPIIGENTNMMLNQLSNNSTYQLNDGDKGKLFKPYQQTQAINLLSKLSDDANEIFGHEVVYFLTDPDRKGIDYSFHEYQLYNYICEDKIKISVDGNNFPDNQIVMNQFDLALFDSFEVHIPKTTFKNIFGVDKRPSKEDFLWFCEINRMYVVEHSQQFRNFNNSSIYYKVMLKKYVQKSNVIAGDQNIADKVKELTKNSTIDETFGLENKQDKKSISNKEQLRPLTRDIMRLNILANINKELIENSSNIISKSNYDLSSIGYDTFAVEYSNFKNYFKTSDNIAFTSWFNINNYTINDKYNFINYYNNSQGIKINLESDEFNINLNSSTYSFDLNSSATQSTADSLFENTWYAYILNIDQRNGKMDQFLYKRNVEDEDDAQNLSETKLSLISKITQTIIPVEFELNMSIKAGIMGSDMKYTNIRMFVDVIPEKDHNKILNQLIIGDDSKYLIFADNANQRIILPSSPLSNGDVLDNNRRGTELR